jgi:hypothetical protein
MNELEAAGSALAEGLEALARDYGNRFLLEPAPDHKLPQHGMRSVDAMRLIGEELVLDGIPQRNLATFVTTWMEPEAQRIIAENLHRRSSSAASGCSPTCSTPPARRPARAPRARRRRSCSARCR